MPTPRLLARAALAAALLLAPAPAAAQFVDDLFAPIPTVPDSGAYPPAVQSAIEEGYRQLALVESPADDVHLEAAKAAFERATEADPRAIHAWNGLGMYELKKDEQWLVILESIKKLFNRDHISMAQNAFRRTLELDPAFHAGRYNLALAFRQARGDDNYRRAAEHLVRLVREAPGFGDAALLLAVTYRDAGDLDAMGGALDSVPGFPEASRRLLQTYAYANTDRPAEAAAAYWAGLEAFETERDAGLYWYDIRPIVEPEVDAEFQTVALDQKADWIRRFWQRAADRTFVTPDERLIEHYRRLHHVATHFRLDLPERRHYSGLAAYVPPWQSGFDDRGVIWLRHGPPDDEASHSGPEVERNLSWKYERADGDPLIFHFVSDEDVSDFKLVRRLSDAIITNSTKMTGQTMLNRQCGAGGRCDAYDARILSGEMEGVRDLYSSRGHLNPIYDRAATGLDERILQDEEGMLAEDIAIGTSSQSYAPPSAGDPLLYPMWPVVFKDPGDRTVVAFYYALPAALVSVRPRAGGGSTVDYRYQLAVHPPTGGDAVARQAQDVTLATSTPVAQDAGTMLPGVRIVPLEPGRYQYGMKVTDLVSGRFGVVQGAIGVDGFAGKDLSMSGVVLAHSVSPASGDGGFVRWGRYKVLPLPSRMFRRTQPVFVYYEVYGLDAGAEGVRYRTTYTLESVQSGRNVVARFISAVGELLARGRDENRITYSFERAQEGAVDPLLEYLSLDVAESPAGEYVLTVEIEDLVGGATVRERVPLILSE